MKRFFYHRITLTSLLFLFFTFSLTAQQQEEEEYWSLVPGILGDQVIMIDSTIVLVSSDWDRDSVNYVYFPGIIRFYHFDMVGTLIKTKTFKLNDIDSLLWPSFLSSLSRHQSHRLSNGNLLIGGHGVVIDPDVKTTQENLSVKVCGEKWIAPMAYDNGSAKESYPMVNPLIATFNSTLDSLLRIDTLEAVLAHAKVTLIHEVAPDTLIIGYHKSYDSNQVILETDSLFNVRWMSEDFGMQDYWVAEIHDFLTTPEGDYLVSMQYRYQWTPHPLGYNKNILFKFDRANGELLWEKELWTNTMWTSKGQNTWAVMAPWKDDKFVIALDDCCKYTNPFHTIIFHNYTGMHLQVRDYDGLVQQEISLRDFLLAYVKVFPGPSAYGGDLEDPDDTAPWFIPYRMIRNPDGTYLVTGIQYTYHWRIFGRGFLLKLDADLQPLWARIYEIDKKNYEYGENYAFLFNVVNTGSQIFLGGSFVTYGFWGTPSPYYPPNYPWDIFFREDLFIALDEYGCYEPGCHLTDNVPFYKLEQAITLAPNPARERVHIQIDHPALAHKDKVLFISDMQGRGMLTQRFSGSSIEVSLAGYTPGVYLVYIMSEGQVLRGERLVVR